MVKSELTRLAYDGSVFKIEFYVIPSGRALTEEWLNSLSPDYQKKFAVLFVRLGDHGKIWNEQKFKHLEGSSQIFEFKADSGRILCFFFHGKRVILTHGFFKKGAKTPKGEIERAHLLKEEFERRIKVWKEN